MNKYPLGRDILVSWALDLGGQSVNLADCDLQFDYSAAGGTSVVPASDYTIENNVLTWTFKKENQHAYGVYNLRLVASSDGVGIAEFNDKAAFEIIHGTPSQEEQALAMQSTVETTQEASPEPEPEPEQVEHYVSRSPLRVEKVPLGSNLIVNWKLLSSDEFDFPLDECDLHLFYAAAGSGCQRAEDYELTNEGGYAVRWNFAADKQVRFGLYALFLDIFYQGARIATLVKDDAFSLVHRRRSGQQADRVIDFESVVTTFGGGALYSDADVINDGYSTVYRGDRTTAAQNYDILQFRDGLWRAVPVSGLAEIIALGGSISGLQSDLSGLTSRVSNAEGDISTLTQTASAIDLRVASAEGNIGDLQLTADSLLARMTDAEGNIGSLELTASSLSTRITDAEGDIGALELTASGLSARITDAEGDISSLELTAQGLTSRVSDAEGNISLLEQTATGLQYQVTNQAGDIATLQVSARGLSSRVSTAEGNISLIDQKADRIALAVEAVSTEVTRYEGVTDAALQFLQDQIDGVIETWYFNGVPTLSTPPVMSSVGHYYNDPWLDGTETPEERAEILNNHIGDLYYDKDTGKAYRFMYDESQNPAVYVWVELADEDIAKALALAGEKKRVFVVTPYAPYDAGDLWVRQKTVGSGTANEIWRCKTSRAAGASPGFLESEWESADNYGYVVNKSNLEVLADAIVGQVTQIAYNADGTVSTQSASTIQQTASAIRLATVVDNVALAGITIDATNQTGSVTIFSDNFFIKDGNNNKTALAITHKANGDSIIDVASLNVEGIFSTSEWSAEEYALQNYADGAASDAQDAAELYAYTYANSTEYLDGVIQSMINSSISGKADDADYSYLKTALENRTTALGGLLLTSLIQLGASVNGSSWTVRAGISGEYFPETDPTAQDYHLGHGIAAWYGGPMTDWKELTEQERLTTPYAKSLFRMDGSGYLASGEIQWGSAGDIILHGVGIEGAAVDENTTFTDGTTTFSVADLIQLRSWFSIDYFLDSNQQRHYYLKLNASGSDGTAIEGFVSNGFISSGGISGGTPSGGGLDVDLMFQYLANAPGLSDHTHDEDQIAIEHLTTALSSYVPKTRKVNGKALSADVALTLDDVNDGSSRKLSDYLVASDIAPLADAIGNLSSGLTGVEGDIEQLREMSATRAWVSNALADSFVKIGSTRIGLGETTLALAGLTSVEATKFYFDANTFFELDANGNVRLVAPPGKLFYTDLSFSSGGISGGTPSGGGLDPVLMFQYLANDPGLSDHTHDEDQIHPLHLSTALTGYVNDLTISGSGNYVASLTKSGKILTATMGTIGDAAFRGIATAIGSSVTGLVDGALLYGILGDAFDASNTVKGFVNSSIATATATFRGTNTTATTESDFLTWANALTHDLNDYVFWKTVDSVGNTVFKRYKYDGTQWVFEYDLNNSSFTAAQWAAINSGITSTKVGSYDTVAGYFENSKIKSANLPAMYLGYSQIAFSQAKTTLLGVNGFTNATSASAENDNTKVVWDSTYSAWHFYGNVIVEGQLSSGGVSSGTPSGGGLDATLMFQYLANYAGLSDHTHDTDQIAAEHLTDVLGDYLKMTTTRAANLVLAGPASGSDAAPTFRALVAADIPSISYSKISDWSTATASFLTATNTDPMADAIGNLATGLTGMAADLESLNEIMATKNWVSNRFLTENQDITLSGDVSGSGKTSINVTIGAGKVTNAMLAGSIANNKLANSKVTIGTTDVSLGASTLVLAGLTSVTATKFYFNANTYFELDSSGNVRLVAPTGKYFYTDVSFSSGGLSSGTPGGGGATSLAALDDVSLVGTPTDGQILAVGANGLWTNIAKDYYTKSQTYTQAEVNALIGAINQFHYEIYASTSVVTNPQANVLYLIGPTGSGSDKYEEYVYSNSTWTKIGDTSIDLSGYMLSSSFTAANIVSTLGNTAVNRATGDGDGNTISSTYLKKSGGTMDGVFTLKANQYSGPSGNHGLNANNSDIVGVNSIYTEDLADDMGEGIHFFRSSGYWDSLTSSNGVLYYYPNRPTSTTAFANAYTIYHSGNFTPSNYVLLTAASQTITGNLYVTGDLGSPSDRNLKTNLKPIKLTAEQISKTFVGTFDWKDGSGSSFGTIAQDWEKLMPAAVGEVSGKKTFSYPNAGVVIGVNNATEIFALQKHETEQDKEIRKLKAKVKSLEDEVKRLRAS